MKKCNKHIPCGPQVNFMVGKDATEKEKEGNNTMEINKKSNDKAENKRIVTVVLYIPSIEHFFAHLCKNKLQG